MEELISQHLGLLGAPYIPCPMLSGPSAFPLPPSLPSSHYGEGECGGLEKEAPSTLVKPDGGRRGGSRAGQGRERGAGPAAGTC